MDIWIQLSPQKWVQVKEMTVIPDSAHSWPLDRILKTFGPPPWIHASGLHRILAEHQKRLQYLPEGAALAAGTEKLEGLWLRGGETQTQAGDEPKSTEKSQSDEWHPSDSDAPCGSKGKRAQRASCNHDSRDRDDSSMVWSNVKSNDRAYTYTEKSTGKMPAYTLHTTTSDNNSERTSKQKPTNSFSDYQHKAPPLQRRQKDRRTRPEDPSTPSPTTSSSSSSFASDWSYLKDHRRRQTRSEAPSPLSNRQQPGYTAQTHPGYTPDPYGTNYHPNPFTPEALNPFTSFPTTPYACNITYPPFHDLLPDFPPPPTHPRIKPIYTRIRPTSCVTFDTPGLHAQYPAQQSNFIRELFSPGDVGSRNPFSPFYNNERHHPNTPLSRGRRYDPTSSSGMGTEFPGSERELGQDFRSLLERYSQEPSRGIRGRERRTRRGRF